MPNDVFRAVDATLVLAVDDATTPEGTAADALVSEYGLSNVVGRLRNLQVLVSTDVRAFYEIGRRYPTHLRPGVVRISGSAERAHVNGALLRLLMGDGAVSPPGSPNFVQPSFNVVTTLTSSALPDQHTTITIFGARLDSWAYQVPADEFVMEAVTFQAMRIAFEEA